VPASFTFNSAPRSLISSPLWYLLAPQQSQSITPNPNAEKNEPEKWLNRTDKQGNVTPEWTNILKGIADNKIKSVQDVVEHSL